MSETVYEKFLKQIKEDRHFIRELQESRAIDDHEALKLRYMMFDAAIKAEQNESLTSISESLAKIAIKHCMECGAPVTSKEHTGFCSDRCILDYVSKIIMEDTK